MRPNRKMGYAVATLMVLGMAGAVQAKDVKNEDAKDAASLQAMKISLSQAIATAEQQGGGKAVGADIVFQGNASHVAVEVVAAGVTKTLTVDGQTGQVTGTTAGGKDEDD